MTENGKMPKGRLNETYLADKPLDIVEFAKVRGHALSAIEVAAGTQTAPRDALVALVQAWEQAPQSALLSIELARAAARADDARRLMRFIHMARTLVAGQPNLSIILDKIGPKQAPQHRTAGPTRPALPEHGTAQRIDGIEDLNSVCTWILKSFAEGRPPVVDVGAQGTKSVDCQTLSPYDLTPELRALPVVAAARGNGQRLFGWIAAQWRGAVWLSPSIVESFVPPFHPDGNGFSIELQRASVFRDGMPELSATITERRTVIDPALNEKSVLERRQLLLVTFDVDPPRVCAPVVLHSRFERSLVAANDSTLPKGYTHSADLGKASEVSYQLKWGDNRAILTPDHPGDAKPVEQPLFTE